MSTAKIPAILVTALGMHVGVSPPTPAVPKGERKTDEGPLDVHVAGLIFKVGLSSACFSAMVWLINAREPLDCRVASCCDRVDYYRCAQLVPGVGCRQADPGLSAAWRSRRQQPDIPVAHDMCGHCNVDDGKRDSVPMLSGAGLPFHVPCHRAEGAQARHDRSVFHRPTPCVYRPRVDVWRRVSVVFLARIVVDGKMFAIRG